MVRWLFKALVFFVVVGFVGLTGFAYFGNLAPEQIELREPVELDVQ